MKFTSEGGSAIVECAYDSMGRQAFKKGSTDGEVKLHQRYIYRVYLQIAALDLVKLITPIIRDPTQPVATRPIAIRKDGIVYKKQGGWSKNHPHPTSLIHPLLLKTQSRQKRGRAEKRREVM